MNTFADILTYASVLVAIVGGAYLIVQLFTAGRGAFLKERNEELASALEQVRQQRNDDRAECQREVSDLRDQLNEVKGELSSYRREYAKTIAAEVIKVLKTDGFVHD